MPTQDPCSSHSAAVLLCHAQCYCHDLCPVYGYSRTFPGTGRGSSRSWQGPPTPPAGSAGDGHSGGCRRCPPRSPRPPVRPCPPGWSPTPHRAGWSRLQQFIICKTSPGSTLSNLGTFLIAGICSAGETGGGQRHGGSGICPGVPLGPLVRVAREADPHAGTTAPHSVSQPHPGSTALDPGSQPLAGDRSLPPKALLLLPPPEKGSPSTRCRQWRWWGWFFQPHPTHTPIAGDVASPISQLAFQTGREGTILRQLRFQTGKSREPARRGWARAFPCTCP